MKLGRRKKEDLTSNVFSRPVVNQVRRNLLIFFVIIITFGLIFWVIQIGRKAEQTIKVVMLARNVYKNQVITEDMLQPYDMLVGEFEKYALVNTDGTVRRKIVLWDERNLIINSFAAYPLKQGTYAEYRDFIKSRVDNSDSVLYSFPGKDIVPLEIGASELEAFKTFLKPGDRLNIQAVFSEKVTVAEDDGYGNIIKKTVDVFKTEQVFGDIMIADLLNNSGESILDIYSYYNDLSIWEQAQLDASQTFKERTTPSTLLVALTPEEKELYYYYLSKTNVQFKVSMPQRVQ